MVELVRTRRIYDGKVVNLRVDTLRDADGETHDAEVVEHAEAVAVIVRPRPTRCCWCGSTGVRSDAKTGKSSRAG